MNNISRCVHGDELNYDFLRSLLVNNDTKRIVKADHVTIFPVLLCFKNCKLKVIFVLFLLFLFDFLLANIKLSQAFSSVCFLCEYVQPLGFGQRILAIFRRYWHNHAMTRNKSCIAVASRKRYIILLVIDIR